jgi:hypothetical protein
MKKGYIISRIECSLPYVYVAFSDANDHKAGSEKQQNPFGPNMMAFTSPEDLMENLMKMMSNISRMTGAAGGVPTDSPAFKMSMRRR